MKIIGLTGGSGTGKGTVAKYMRRRGAGWVNADAVYRRLCETNEEMLSALARAFGDILTTDGALDRPRLAAIVFSDAEKLRRLNELTFPYIRAASLVELQAQADHSLVFYDAPTLFENGADSLCDTTVGVLARLEDRVARIMRRDGISEAAAHARVLAQPNDAFYRAHCAYILENNGNFAALRRNANALYTILDTLPTSSAAPAAKGE